MLNRAVMTYAETAFPAHRVEPVRTVTDHRDDGRTVVASYHSLHAASDAAASLPTRVQWDEVEMAELVAVDAPMTAANDPQGPAGLSGRRLGAGAGIAAIVGTLLAGVLVLAIGSTAPVVILGLVAGAVLGAVIGLAVSGGARFGGERGAMQAAVPSQSSVAVLSVWVPDEGVARVVADALQTRDPIEVTVLQAGGFRHSPGSAPTTPVRPPTAG